MFNYYFTHGKQILALRPLIQRENSNSKLKFVEYQMDASFSRSSTIIFQWKRYYRNFNHLLRFRVQTVTILWIRIVCRHDRTVNPITRRFIHLHSTFLFWTNNSGNQSWSIDLHVSMIDLSKIYILTNTIGNCLKSFASLTTLILSQVRLYSET